MFVGLSVSDLLLVCVGVPAILIDLVRCNYYIHKVDCKVLAVLQRKTNRLLRVV